MLRLLVITDPPPKMTEISFSCCYFVGAENLRCALERSSDTRYRSPTTSVCAQRFAQGVEARSTLMSFFKKFLNNSHNGGHHSSHGSRSYASDVGYTNAPAHRSTGMSCPNCNTSITQGSRFCQQCGKSLVPTMCNQCKTPMQPGEKFCSQCGTASKRD